MSFDTLLRIIYDDFVNHKLRSKRSFEWCCQISILMVTAPSIKNNNKYF